LARNKNPKTIHRRLSAVVLFCGLLAHQQAMADDNLCTSSNVSALQLDIDKAQEQDIAGSGNHYTNIILSLSPASSDALLTMTSQNIGGLLGYCIGGESAGSTGYIKSPFPVVDSSGGGLAHIVIDRSRFDAGELLKRINSKTVPIKAVIEKRDGK
jgi:hypothetical protein